MKSRLLVVFGLLVGATVWAMDDSISDFVFENMVDEWSVTSLILYPDLSTDRNPSVALDAERLLLFPTLSLSFGPNITAEGTVPEPLANAGATTSGGDRIVDFRGTGARVIAPVGNDMVVGGTLFGGLYRRRFERVDDGVTSPGATITTTQEDDKGELRVGALYAITLGNLDLGVRGRYRRNTDLGDEEFTWVSGDPAANETYTTGPAYTSDPYTDTFTESIVEAAVGARYRYEAMTFGLATEYFSDFDDTSVRHVAVDTDGDGYDDAVVTEEEQQTSTEAWGNGLDAYSRVETSSVRRVTIRPHATWRVSDEWQLVTTAYWRPFSETRWDSYERTSAADQTVSAVRFDFGLTDLGILAGAEWTPTESWAVRGGLGYEFAAARIDRVERDAAGQSTYSPGNENNYPEITLGGVEPEIGDLMFPVESRAHRMNLLTGVFWNPLSRLRLFGDAELTITAGRNTNKAYDTTSGDVWEETRGVRALEWSLTTLVGLAFELTDSTTLAFEAGNNVVSSATTSGGTITLPEGPDGPTDNPGGSVGQLATREFSLTISAVLAF